MLGDGIRKEDVVQLIRRVLGVGILVGLFVFAWKFGKQNGTIVDVYYGLGTATGVTLGESLALAFVGGAALACVAMLIPYFRSRMLVRRYRKSVERLEKEIHELRNLPLSVESALGEHDEDMAVAGRQAYTEDVS